MPGFLVSIKDDCNRQENIGDPSNNTETARKHRYQLEILEPLSLSSFSILSYLKKCNRPGFEYDKVMIYNGGDSINRPGIRKWKPVTMTFYEVVTSESSPKNRTAELIYDWRTKVIGNVDTGLLNKPSSFLKTCVLAMLDGDNRIIWKYTLYDCWPSNYDPCDLSYSESDIADISLTLQYSRAIEE